MRDSSGVHLKYLHKSDVVLVVSCDSVHYWVRDEVGDRGAVLQRELTPVTGKVYLFNDEIRDAAYHTNFFIRPLTDTIPMIDSFGVVLKYYGTDDRLMVHDGDSGSYWIDDDNEYRGFVRRDAVTVCEGKSNDFGGVIPMEQPLPFYHASHYEKDTTDAIPDPEIEALLRELEALTETSK